MSFRWTAFVAVASSLASLAFGQELRTLTLEAAFTRTLEKHPELARFDYLRDGARAELEAQSMRAPIRLDFELENAPRTNQDSSLDTAEATLSLAGVFERGGKRDARRSIATAAL